MKSFWQLNRNWFDMLNLFEENGGEETDEMKELLAINRQDLDEKVEEQLIVLGTLETDNERLKSIIIKSKEKININDLLIGRIKKNIVSAINLYSEGKLKTNSYNLSVKTTKALHVFDANDVPRRFVRYTLDMNFSDEMRRELLRVLSRFNPKFTPEVDKVALKKAVEENDVVIKGFEIKQNESLVRR